MSRFTGKRWLKERVSVLMDTSALKKIILLMVLTMLAVIISTGIGDMQIAPWKVVSVFFGGGSSID